MQSFALLNDLQSSTGCVKRTPIALFEEGMKLSKALEKDLARVERRVQILTNEPGGEDEEPAMELFPELEEEE